MAATRIGDPEADAVIAELSKHDTAVGEEWIRQGIEAVPPTAAWGEAALKAAED